MVGDFPWGQGIGPSMVGPVDLAMGLSQSKAPGNTGLTLRLYHSLDIRELGSSPQHVELTLTFVSWLCKDGRSQEVEYLHIMDS